MEENYSTYRWVMMGTVCWAIASIYIVMITFSPILGTIAADLNVSMGAAMNLMMGFVLSVAFFLMWGGSVVDKFGITTALVLGLLCSFIPAVLQPAIGHTYNVVFVSRLIEGASVGFIFACIGPVLGLWFPPKERGLAGGLMIGSLSAGSAIGVVASPAILASVGSWQLTSAYLSIPAAVGIVLAIALTRKSPVAIAEGAEVAAASSGSVMTFGEAFKMPITWLGSFLIFFNSWNLYVLLNIVPGYLAHPIGVNLGEIVAGQVSLSVTLAGVAGMVVGGIIFDRVFRGYAKPSVMIGFAIGGIFTALILTSGVTGNLGLLVIVLLIAGVGIPFMNGALSAHIAMTYPPEIVGRMVGWWFGFGTIGGALGLFLGGMLIDMTGSFMWSIMLAVFVCVAGFILGSFLKRPAMQ